MHIFRTLQLTDADSLVTIDIDRGMRVCEADYRAGLATKRTAKI